VAKSHINKAKIKVKMYADKDTNIKIFKIGDKFYYRTNVTTWMLKKIRGAMDRPLSHRRRNIRRKLQNIKSKSNEKPYAYT